ncbi:uncharacterized protein LOC112270984 isoform X2 [Brachypodium distachyon]|uniref:uncharacterized protein LOC112270984 isoform X2 n=1 Tax=Brachypodium distachyon TaxID=15368 RepID=UPI000D0D3354|nr:uncharacterized protein LOC112270984 isoform X2 [Brachypodium distachyon]|eukprot:XP_024315556.1 uncharacterized protein LOC112270984 isoform X2 [Brachypodium distachyon]
MSTAPIRRQGPRSATNFRNRPPPHPSAAIFSLPSLATVPRSSTRSVPSTAPTTYNAGHRARLLRATEPLHARVCIDLSLPPRMCPRMRTGSHGFSTLCWPLLHHHNHSSPQPLPVTLQPKESLQGQGGS